MTTSLQDLEAAALRVVDDVRALQQCVVDVRESIPLRRDDVRALLSRELPLIYAEQAADIIVRCARGRTIR